MMILDGNMILPLEPSKDWIEDNSLDWEKKDHQLLFNSVHKETNKVFEIIHI